tara:strand:- start:248 stop:799 length:552 start_codon:yes stop_codon:yes gene_type:complete
MNETANILNNITNRSLILLDEIGRGTSTYDGLAIAWSITEYLHKHNCYPITLFATHYHELIELAEKLKRAQNLSVAISEKDDSIVFRRKIIKGGTNKSYGIHVAKMAGIPSTVIRRSDKILNNLSKDELDINKIPIESFDNKEIDIKELKKLKKKILSINLNNTSPVEAIILLNELIKDAKQN